MVSLPNARPRYTPGQPRAARPRPAGLTLRNDLAVFGAACVVLAVAAAFFFYALDVYNPDALSRTMDAHNVLYSRDPHLGAMGLAWPPIPTFLRVLLLPVTSRVGLTEFTGPLTSVIAAAGCVVLLNRILARLGLDAVTRGVWIAASMVNPVLLYHFTNGTAESVFAFFFLWVLLAALRIREAPEAAALGMGVATGLALWARYEAAALMVMGVLGFLLVTYVDRTRGTRREITRLESLLVALAAPTVALGLLWLAFNWMMQGDALFFYRGPYSINAAPDVAKNAVDHALDYAHGSILGSLHYVARRMLELSFLFPVAVAAAVVAGLRKRDMTGPVLALLALSTLLMQFSQTFSGTIAPWLRYWVYLPLLTIVLLAWAGQVIEGRMRRRSRRMLALAAVPALILLGSAVTWRAMGAPDAGLDERLIVAEVTGDAEAATALRRFYADRNVLAEVERHLLATEGIVLVDLQQIAPLILSFEETDRLAINTDRDFGFFLDQPAGNVDYVLLPDPSAENVELARDAIYSRYPDLYDGADWLTLDRAFDGAEVDWRLYRVLGEDGAGAAAAR